MKGIQKPKFLFLCRFCKAFLIRVLQAAFLFQIFALLLYDKWRRAAQRKQCCSLADRSRRPEMLGSQQCYVDQLKGNATTSQKHSEHWRGVNLLRNIAIKKVFKMSPRAYATAAIFTAAAAVGIGLFFYNKRKAAGWKGNSGRNDTRSE